MGIQPDVALGAIRLTLGRATTHRGIHTATTAIIDSWHNDTPTG
jgi:cysteine sulfinate desulfinase/cysteine desulfurase-like protein